LSDKARADLLAYKQAGPPNTAGAYGPSQNFLSYMQSKQAKDLLLGASVDIDEIKKTREAMKDLWETAKGGDTNARIAYRQKKAELDVLEAKMDEAARIWGKPDLVERLGNARKMIAKNYAIQNSSSNAYGLIDPNDLSALEDSGAMLTGRLKQMADFSKAFSRDADDIVKLAPAQSAGGGVNYAARNVLQGRPLQAGSAVAPSQFGGELAKDALLSDWMQNRMTKPIMVPNPETAASLAVRSGLLTGGRGETPTRRKANQ